MIAGENVKAKLTLIKHLHFLFIIFCIMYIKDAVIPVTQKERKHDFRVCLCVCRGVLGHCQGFLLQFALSIKLIRAALCSFFHCLSLSLFFLIQKQYFSPASLCESVRPECCITTDCLGSNNGVVTSIEINLHYCDFKNISFIVFVWSFALPEQPALNLIPWMW